MFKGFKEFITRGNVMELAIAVIIGAAFTAIVTAISDSLIQPLINSFGGAEVDGLNFQLRDGMPSTTIDLGAILTAIINFFIIAGVVYFILVAPMNKLNEMNLRRKGIDPEESEASETDLLIEIRDLLAAQSGVTDPDKLADIAADVAAGADTAAGTAAGSGAGTASGSTPDTPDSGSTGGRHAAK